MGQDQISEVQKRIDDLIYIYHNNKLTERSEQIILNLLVDLGFNLELLWGDTMRFKLDKFISAKQDEVFISYKDIEYMIEEMNKDKRAVGFIFGLKGWYYEISKAPFI